MSKDKAVDNLDQFFQNEEVQDVLISRAQQIGDPSQLICISGEDVDGVHMRYTTEYFRWKFKARWIEVAVCKTEEQRKQWFIDNPEPEVKFVNHKEQITDIVGKEKL